MSQQLDVLLLEDQALVRAGMRALIEISEPAATVHEAADHDAAIEILARTEIAIAFLDIDLKGQTSGIDVLRHIRTGSLTTRAIMLSAIADEATVMECLRLGASGYIQKDVRGDGLFRQALDTIFDGGVFLPEPIAHPTASPNKLTPLQELEEIGIKGRAAEVLYYICQGLPNQMIAYKMGIAESTIANDYNTRLFRKFRVTNRAGLIVEVARRGLILPVPSERRQESTAR